MPSTTEFTKSMLALFMWQQDGPDGVTGMMAVGLAIRNRVRAGWYGGDWLAVIDAHPKTAAHAPPTATLPDIRDPKFRSVLYQADTIYDGSEPDITAGGLYFAQLGEPDISPWFRDNILAKPDVHKRIGTVGQLTFFS